MSDEQINMACKGKSKSQGGLNIGDIKQILKEMGLPTTGNRQHLLDRLCPLTKDKREDAGVSESKTGTDKFMYDRSDKPLIIKIGDIKLDMSTFSTLIMREYILHSVNMNEKRQIIELSDDFIYHMRKSVESSKFETGGMIDIDNDGVFERATFRIGNSGSVHLKELMDYEIYYHIHPPRPFLFDLPSLADVLFTYFSEGQVQFVFAIDAIYSIYMDKTKFFDFMYNTIKKYKDLSFVEKIPKFKDSLREHIGDLNKIMVSSTAYLNYVNKLKDIGVYIVRQTGIKKNTWPKKVIAFIEPYEEYNYVVPDKIID